MVLIFFYVMEIALECFRTHTLFLKNVKLLQIKIKISSGNTK